MKKTKRTFQINFRVSDKEHQMIVNLAAANGESVASLLRRLSFAEKARRQEAAS
jgi:predicted HicB family RNase H-like nuclease